MRRPRRSILLWLARVSKNSLFRMGRARPTGSEQNPAALEAPATAAPAPKLPLAEALNATLFKTDLDRTEHPSKYATTYANLPRPR